MVASHEVLLGRLMKCHALKIVTVIGFAAFLTTASVSPVHAGCVPWKSAGKVISKNGLVPGGTIYKKVKSKTGGKVISANLCENGGKFVYKIKVLGKKGDVKTLTINAKTGQF